MAKCRVLIVDDEPAFLSGLWGLFGESYSLFTATNAEIALQTLARERIDVIVTDYKMPGMTGLELLVEVKKRFPNVIRVLMTAYADMDLVVRALNEGEIQRFIAKPYRASEFSRILGECRDLAVLAAGRPEGPRDRTVLVAHDSTISTTVLRQLLSPAYNVLTTANGVEAMNWLVTRKIDAIVLGVGLELLDGCTIVNYLKKERGLATPVVFWSKDVEGSYGEYLEECGADLVLDQQSQDSLSRLERFLSKTLA
jgi:CheY-like chemotaxis protein